MAQIELRLSAKSDKTTGLNEVLIRFYEGSKFNLRSKSNIFVASNHFEFYINREATEKNGIKVKPKDITATKSEAIKKGYILYDRGIIVSNGIIENNDKKIHDAAKKKAKELCEYIINMYNETDKEQIANDWLKITIDKFLYPEKYIEKQNEKPSFFQLFEIYLNEKSSSDSWVKNNRVLFRDLARWEAFVQFKQDKNFTLDIDTITKDDISNFREYLRKEKTLSEKYPKFFEKILQDYPSEIGTKRKSPKLVDRGNNSIVILLKKLKAFFSWANKTERSKNMPFIGIEIGSEVYGTPFYLTKEERDLIAVHDFSYNKVLSEQRDIFIFQCLVGCRVSDLMQLTKDNISNGVLSYVPQKTKEDNPRIVRVPLLNYAIELVNKYNGIDKKGRLFPFITSQRYNDNIKKILRACNINRMVIVRNSLTGNNEAIPLCDIAASHIARKTFIGNLYEGIKDPNIIAKMSGHVEGSKAFNRYRDISDNTLQEALKNIDLK